MEGWTDGWRWWVYRDGGTDGGQAGWIDEWADSWEFRWRRGWMDVSGCKYANMHWEMWKNDYSDTCIVLQSHCEGKIHVSSKRGGGCCTCCIMLPRLVALCQTMRTAAIMTDLWNRTTLKHSSCELTRYSISLLAVSRSRYLEALKNDPTGFFENLRLRVCSTWVMLIKTQRGWEQQIKCFWMFMSGQKKKLTQGMLGRGNWVILTSEAFKILVLKFSTISNMFMQMKYNHNLLQNQEYGLVQIIQKRKENAFQWKYRNFV